MTTAPSTSIKPFRLSWETSKVDLQSLALFRILMGVYLFCDLIFYLSPNFTELFTNMGVVPDDVWHRHWRNVPFYSVLGLSSSPIFTSLFQIIYGAAALAFAFGYWTRISNFVLMICYMSVYWRNPLLHSNAEMLTNSFLIWCMFLPLNRYWSVDSALGLQPRNRPSPIIPVTAIKVQISCIYIFSGIFKLAGLHTWISGMAVIYALNDTFYANSLGKWVFDNFADALPFASVFVMVFQLAFSALVYSPWYNDSTRALAFFGAIVMHGSFIFFLNVGLFPYLCILYLMVIVPDRWWNALLEKRRARLKNVRIYYDTDCGFCKKMALLFREFCLPADALVAPASSNEFAQNLLRVHNSWVVYGDDGKTYIKSDAGAYLLKHSFVFFPLGYLIAFFKKPADALYEAIGCNRKVLGKITAEFLPWYSEPTMPRIFQLLCGFMSIILVSYALLIIPQINNVPRPLDRLARFFQINQRWNIFAPVPTSYTRELHFIAHLNNGETKELDKDYWFNIHKEDDNIHYVFGQHRWLKFYERVFTSDSNILRVGFVDFLCRKYNAVQTNDSEKATSFTVQYLVMPSPVNGINLKNEVSGSYGCP